MTELAKAQKAIDRCNKKCGCNRFCNEAQKAACEILQRHRDLVSEQAKQHIKVDNSCESCSQYGKTCSGETGRNYFELGVCKVTAIEWDKTTINGFGKKQQISKCGKFVRTFIDYLQDWGETKTIIFGE